MKKNQNQNKNQIMVSRTHVMKATVTVMLKNELFDNELFNKLKSILWMEQIGCAIYFYYSDILNHSSKFCSSCIIRMHDLFLRLHVVRQHVIKQYARIDSMHIDSMYCKECRDPLYKILPCNLCPICNVKDI